MLSPRDDRVLAKPIAGPEQVGGVILPEAARENTQQAVVLAVGPHPDVQDLHMGAVIAYAPYGGVKINDPDHGDVLILRHSDVIAIVKK
jgi:co-chaperonin GroES (HSP10)